MQLAVNPYMGSVTRWATAALRGAMARGPVRMYRLAKVVVFPFLYGAVKLLVKFVWLPLVEVGNSPGNIVKGLL